MYPTLNVADDIFQPVGGNEKMVRFLATILFACCLVAQLGAQAPPASKDEATKEQEPAAPTATAASASAEYPLDAFKEFSAIMVGSVMNGDDREAYIYRSGNLMRASGNEEHNYLITDLSTLQTFGVAATGCMHDGNPYFRSAPFSTRRPGYTVGRAITGQETVDGHSCKIEDVTLTSPKLARVIKLRLWEAEDLQGFPVKVEFLRPSKHDPVIHYKNVVLGPQDPTLFIYPNSCQSSSEFTRKAGTRAPTGAKKPAGAPPTAAPQN
jgi:hypothetical protein